MKTDPLFDPDTDRTDFITSYPHSRVIGIASAGDTKMLKCENHSVQQAIHITLGRQTQLMKRKDGIDDELSWFMRGDFTAAIGCDHFDTSGLKRLRLGQDKSRVGIFSQGQNRLMLEHHDSPKPLAFADFAMKLMLDFKRFAIGKQTAFENVEGPLQRLASKLLGITDPGPNHHRFVL